MEIQKPVWLKRVNWKAVTAALGPLLLVFALFFLHHELRIYHLHDILGEFRSLHFNQVLRAMGFTALGYFVLTTYDAIAFRTIKNRLSYIKIAFGAFLGYAFSSTVGFSVLTSGTIRYRLYSAWGLSARDISRIIAYCSFAFWMGFLAVCGCIFLTQDLNLPEFFPRWLPVLPLAGSLCLACPVAYLLFSVIKKEPIKIGSFVIPIPPLQLSFLQIVCAACDWIFMGAVLYSYLPSVPGLTFMRFLTAFLFAQLAAVVSHVPGGIGVFESLMIALMPPELKAPTLLGSMVAFRITYYLVPFLIAVVSLGVFESTQHLPKLQKTVSQFEGWAKLPLAQIYSLMSFLLGALLLLSSALPAKVGRLTLLKSIFPLGVIEIAHLAAASAGLLLLYLAQTLSRRPKDALGPLVFFSSLGAVASLLKGGQMIQCSLLLGFVVIIQLSRKDLIARSTAGDLDPTENPRFRWMAARFTVLALYFWIGLFSYKHLQYSSDLWFHFNIYGDASRFMRASAFLIVIWFIREASRPGRREDDREENLTAQRRE